MAKITAGEARDKFSDMVNRAAYGKERIILTRRGKDLVAMVPLEDLTLIEMLEDHIDIDEAQKAWDEQGDDAPVNWKAVKKRLGIK